MENVINKSLKKQNDLEKLKIKIFSKTLNSKHNINTKELLIYHIQPFISYNYTKEKLALKEDCLSNKLFENIDIYYDIKQSKENLKNIIKKKNKYKYIHLFPTYINLDNYVLEKMIDYRAKKQKAEYELMMIKKIKERKQKKEKESGRLSYFMNPNCDFINSMRNEGIKAFNRRISKKLSLIRRKRENKIIKNVILLKQEMFKENKKYKEFIDKRENIFLINNLQNSINKIKTYYI